MIGFNLVVSDQFETDFVQDLGYVYCYLMNDDDDDEDVDGRIAWLAYTIIHIVYQCKNMNHFLHTSCFFGNNQFLIVDSFQPLPYKLMF